jgi:hypothetical protein
VFSVATALVVFSVLTAACSDARGEGPVRHVCGQIINSTPGTQRVTWLDDLTTAHPREIDIPATPTAESGTAPWLLVSKDCTHGATVSITPTGTTTYRGTVRTTDGHLAAIKLDAHHLGVVTVTVSRSGRVVSTTVVRTT